MTRPGQDDASRAWWWTLAKLLDDAQFAAANASASDPDDPSLRAIRGSLNSAQTILLKIFYAKGLVPPSLARPPIPEAEAEIENAASSDQDIPVPDGGVDEGVAVISPGAWLTAAASSQANDEAESADVSAPAQEDPESVDAPQEVEP